MDFTARSCWIYEDTVPDTDKAKRYGIWYIYIDPRSGNAASVISQIRAAGLYPGAYFAQSWQPGLTAVQFADWVSTTLNTLLPRQGTAEAPPCMLDIENHNTQFIIDAINEYRLHQAARPTSLTYEPFQGATIPYSILKSKSIHVYVQMYYGDMSPVADQAAALDDAERLMNDPSMVHPFYDGARWNTDQWQGCQYTLERLP